MYINIQVLLRLEVPHVVQPSAHLQPTPHSAACAPGGGRGGEGGGEWEGRHEGKVRVMVQWRDDYQLAFAVELQVRMELPDFELHPRFYFDVNSA